MSKIYDVIVLGAGPAGLAAGLYAGRSRLSVLIVEKGQDGGQISITDEIENYPGQIVDQPESGPDVYKRQEYGRLLQLLDGNPEYPCIVCIEQGNQPGT